MKTTAEKSSTTTSSTVAQLSQRPFVARAGAGSFFSPAQDRAVPGVQMKMTVNKPGDKFEQEADQMADRVMRMPTPLVTGKDDKLQRQAEEKIQKREEEKIF